MSNLGGKKPVIVSESPLNVFKISFLNGGSELNDRPGRLFVLRAKPLFFNSLHTWINKKDKVSNVKMIIRWET